MGLDFVLNSSYFRCLGIVNGVNQGSTLPQVNNFLTFNDIVFAVSYFIGHRLRVGGHLRHSHCKVRHVSI